MKNKKLCNQRNLQNALVFNFLQFTMPRNLLSEGSEVYFRGEKMYNFKSCIRKIFLTTK